VTIFVVIIAVCSQHHTKQINMLCLTMHELLLSCGSYSNHCTRKG
jgi:hypothetical protein